MRMLAGEVGEFEAEMTRVKWQNGSIVVEAKGAALWSPLPIMGVWDMKLSITMKEFPGVLKLMFLFVLRDGFKIIRDSFSGKKPSQ